MKKILYIILTVLIILSACEKKEEAVILPLINGCTDTNAINYNSSATFNDGSCVGICIGCLYQGGIIFWLDGSGGGLIASPSDQIETFWGIPTEISGADEVVIGTGNQNTIDIEVGCITPQTAADICANLSLSGYNDWFLPSKDELNEMYLNIGQGNALGLGNIGGFANYFYWSSTELDNYIAWVQYFFNGSKFNFVSKSANCCVRAVRIF